MNQLLAQALFLPDGTKIEGPKDLNINPLTIGGILSRAIPLIFVFAGIGLLFMIISGGFTLLTSAGDPKKLDQGKNQLTNAFIGFVIIFAAFWIVRIFSTIFGLENSVTGFF